MPHSTTEDENRFDKLVIALRDALASSGPLASDIDESTLTRLMQNYQSKETEWSRFAFADPERAYTRNLVDKGNGKSNLLVLVWNPGRGSPVHSHSNAHCIMKILRGELTETRYEYPTDSAPTDSTSSHHPDTNNLTLLSQNTHRSNDVAYMSDDLGVHKMWNNSTEPAISLHLYTPPNIARDGCYVFDDRTGTRTLVKGCEYYSVYGVKGVKGET